MTKKMQPPGKPGQNADLDMVSKYLGVYGADISKWPVALREKFANAKNASEISKERAEAELIDRLLNEASWPEPGQTLEARIIADFDAQNYSAKSHVRGWYLRANWLAPASAAACVALLGGLAAGVLSVRGEPAPGPEYEAFAYFQDTSEYLLIEEEEISQWAVE